MFPGFQRFEIETDTPSGGATIRGRAGGSGPPLLLLHGYPQTGAMWHLTALALAEHYSVVVPDLRGYGRSSKPGTAPDHAPYSKREMALDMVQVMAALGHERFHVGAHDRGARVAHRMALDHPGAVRSLALLDIAPTREMYRETTEGFARAYWHWFFLTLPAPHPETMIGADPEAFWRLKCGSGWANGSPGLDLFAPEALAEYLACWTPEAIHASCEDYRAAATIDIAHDDADGKRRVAAPTLVLWGANGAVGRWFDPLALWRRRAAQVTGRALPGGHYLAEELPEAVTEAMLEHFSTHEDS
ncbi:alpha/beta fold hydrolase [Jannaschia sp. W003]|uniref:alpha/beta fold hydrolase n=1 Tax=Jannaschia sp. W003 TaxID=2867012 RepID=UPI0021A3E2D5|nr:alpha/beta hydrolase [Jannaschia sp. W003]UWQ23129.1 alpha/beta hydrolase [Jannaschia sp. W003]